MRGDRCHEAVRREQFLNDRRHRRQAAQQVFAPDFGMLPQQRRLTSLAFNLTGVDVTPDMGPFEIAPGTQFDNGSDWKHQMFPDKALWSGFAERAVKKYPQMGDISCRSALTMHRGTAHGSPIARPVLVLGVDAPGAGHDLLHDLMVTQDYFDALPPVVRDHLTCRVVSALVPVTQKHDIEGLVMGTE